MKPCQFCGNTSLTGNHYGLRKPSKATPTICYECVEIFFDKQTTPPLDHNEMVEAFDKADKEIVG